MKILLQNYKISVLAMLLIFVNLPHYSSAATADPVASSLTGQWRGSYILGPDSPREIIFSLQWSADGYKAILDLPAQGIAGVAAESVILKGNELTVKIPAVQAVFYGSVRPGAEAETEITRIDGDWSQIGETVAVTLYKK